MHVWYYDSTTGRLSDTGRTDTPDGYFCVDVYRPGEITSNCYSPLEGTAVLVQCSGEAGYCVRWLVAAANPRGQITSVEVYVNDSCLEQQQLPPYPEIVCLQDYRNCQAVVYGGENSSYPCRQGFAEAWIERNGQRVAYDRIDR